MIITRIITGIFRFFLGHKWKIFSVALVSLCIYGTSKFCIYESAKEAARHYKKVYCGNAGVWKSFIMKNNENCDISKIVIHDRCIQQTFSKETNISEKIEEKIIEQQVMNTECVIPASDVSLDENICNNFCTIDNFSELRNFHKLYE
jgi:hypothetical protein